jgi:ribosomal protein L37AE/L43A
MKKPLLIVLIIAAVGAAGYWGYQIFSSQRERAELAAALDAQSESLYCPECKKTTVLTRAEVRKLPRQGDKVQCPNCKKFSVTVGGPSPKGIVAP